MNVLEFMETTAAIVVFAWGSSTATELACEFFLRR